MLTLLTMLAAASAAGPDIRSVLRDQGFEGPLNGRETIQYAGDIRLGQDDYQIYSYHGVVRAARVDHGVNRLIVIRNGSTFVGQYDIPMPTRCKVPDRTVFCDTKAPGRTVRFTKKGPPDQIWFDGEVEPLRYGNRLKR